MVSAMDRYTLQARVAPAAITVAPIAFAIVAWFPAALGVMETLGALGISTLAGFVLAEISSDWSKRKEHDLWESWGGAPTTRFFRHSDKTIDPITKARYHARLRDNNLYVPDASEESENPTQADLYYQSAATHIRKNTYQDALVAASNREYGFRRNSFGLRSLAVTLSLLATLVSAWSTQSGWGVIPSHDLAVAVVMTALSTSSFLYWMSWVTSRWVSMAADRYALALLGTLDHQS